MPIYEYSCNKCNHGFEILIRGDEKPLCPECGDGDLAKKFSVFGVGSKSTEPAASP